MAKQGIGAEWQCNLLFLTFRDDGTDEPKDEGKLSYTILDAGMKVVGSFDDKPSAKHALKTAKLQADADAANAALKEAEAGPPEPEVKAAAPSPGLPSPKVQMSSPDLPPDK